MKRTTLRRTILFYVSLLLVGLIVAMLGFVNYLSNSFVNDRIDDKKGYQFSHGKKYGRGLRAIRG